MQRLFSFLLRRNTVLIVMVVAAVVTGLADGFSQGTGRGWFNAAVVIFVFSALAWFTYTKQPVATWTTVVLLLIKGSDLLYDAVLGVTGANPEPVGVLIAKGVAGIYLTWGALVVHRDRYVKR